MVLVKAVNYLVQFDGEERIERVVSHNPFEAAAALVRERDEEASLDELAKRGTTKLTVCEDDPGARPCTIEVHTTVRTYYTGTVS